MGRVLLLLALVAAGCSAPASAEPRAYSEGCHVPQERAEPRPCVGGDRDAATAVYLFGDSHAAQWFPALDALGEERGWRLVGHTKSACTPWEVPVLLGGREYAECEAWRDAVLEEIGRARPAAVVVTGSRRYAMPGPTLVRDDPEAWAEGMRRTIEAIDNAVILAETPWLRDGEPYGDEGYAALEREAAAATGAVLIDPCADACPGSAFRDQHHLTVAYSESLAPLLGAALP